MRRTMIGRGAVLVVLALCVALTPEIPALGQPATAEASSISGAGASSELLGVSCSTSDFCVVVGGFHGSDGSGQGIIDGYANGNWSPPQTAPLPADAAADPQAVLRAVSCAGPSACVAVGSYVSSANQGEGLIEVLSGTTWTPEQAPLPADATEGTSNPASQVVLNSVSCPSEDACVASGSYDSFTAAVLEVETPGGWSPTEAPPPTGVTPSALQINQVSCSGPGQCAAVGNYEQQAPAGCSRSCTSFGGVLEAFGAGSWQPTDVGIVSQAGPPDGATALMGMSGVSCVPGQFSCVAVGTAPIASSNPSLFARPVIERLSGGSWTLIDPASLPFTYSSELGWVSCSAIDNCVATGQVSAGIDAGQAPTRGPVPPTSVPAGLIEWSQGGSWYALRAPEPADANPEGAPGNNYGQGFPIDYQVGAVSCSAPGSCVAVGVYPAKNGLEEGMLEVLAGGSWTAIPAPVPPDASSSSSVGPYVRLAGVSCGSPTSCVAAGSYETTSTGATKGLVEGITAPAGGSAVPAPPCPPGADSCQSATSAATTGATASAGPITAQGNGGSGSLTVATYGADPVGPPSFPTANQYFSVDIGLGSTFTSLSLQDCAAPSGDSLYWWDGPYRSWRITSSPARSSGCITTTLRDTGLADGGNPSLLELPGVVFALAKPTGYRLVGSDGGIFSFGPSPFEGSTGGRHLDAAVVGMATTPDDEGYWLVAADGGVFSFGDATFYGSAANDHLSAPAVGIAATPDGRGYWIATRNGAVYSFGDAPFYGVLSGNRSSPVVAIVAQGTAAGYDLVQADGNVAPDGAVGTVLTPPAGQRLNAPIVAATSAVDHRGPPPDHEDLWLVGADGGVFTGEAYFGSTGGMRLNRPIVGLVPTADRAGYWLVAADGGVFSFGDAMFYGSMGGTRLNKGVVGG